MTMHNEPRGDGQCSRSGGGAMDDDELFEQLRSEWQVVVQELRETLDLEAGVADALNQRLREEQP